MDGWLALPGLLSGFAGRKATIEQQNLEEAHASQQREGKIFEALINSPDKDTRDLAIAGLLHSAQPGKRKSGLSGWLGEMQQSPYLESIRQLSPTVETQEPTTSLPSQQTSGYISEPAGLAPPTRALRGVLAQYTNAPEQYISEPPGPQPLAQAETSPTEVGAPPPRQVETNLTTTAAPPMQTGTRTVHTPRQMFRTPEETAAAVAEGHDSGRISGVVGGIRKAGGVVSPEDAKQIGLAISGYSGGGAGAQTYAEGNVEPDPNSPTGYSQLLYLRSDPRQQRRIPAQPPTAQTRSAGVNRDALARKRYGKGYNQLTLDEAAEVLQDEQTYLRTSATNRAEGANAAILTKPIGVGEAQRTNTIVGTTPADYVGQAVPSTQEQDQRRGVENVRDQLTHIETLLAAALPKQGDLGALAPGAALAIRRRSPSTRTQVAALESAIDNMVNVLARTVGQQRGAQTEQDATRAYNTVVALKARLLDPLAGDTVESATARIGETRQYLEAVLQRLPATPAPSSTTTVGVPPPTPTGGGDITLRDPRGVDHPFTTQAAADSFRQSVEAAGGTVTPVPSRQTTPGVALPRPNVAPTGGVGAAQPRVAPVGTPPPTTSPTTSATRVRTLSPGGLAQLKEREGGFVANTYDDAGGFAIGYGMHTWKGKPVTKHMQVTQPAADAEILQQIQEVYAPLVDNALTVPVTQPQYDALISLAWNSPTAARTLIKKLNAGMALTAQDFQRSATSRGRPNVGLSTRRRAEFAPFQ